MCLDLLEFFNLNSILLSHTFSIIELKEVSNFLVCISLKQMRILLLIKQPKLLAIYNSPLIHNSHSIIHLLVAIISILRNSQAHTTLTLLGFFIFNQSYLLTEPELGRLYL